VLEGSVRKAGGRVRITAQLIDGGTGGHVWAERYDRDLTDIFALQDEISEAIVKALRLKLLPEEKKAIERRGTDNVDAYNLYLMARQHWVSGNWGDPKREETVVRLCARAAEIDPAYARAWTLMGLAPALPAQPGRDRWPRRHRTRAGARPGAGRRPRRRRPQPGPGRPPRRGRRGDRARSRPGRRFL
jgi:adenylate cyclase